MPEIPDFIKKRMQDRLEYGTEEFVARRILRAAGVVGKGPVAELRAHFFDKYEDPTPFDMATYLLGRKMVLMDPKFRAVAVKKKSEAEEEYLLHPERDDGLVLFARYGDSGSVVYATIDKLTVPMVFIPPYRVFAEAPDDMVRLEQEIEPFCRSFHIGDVAQDILHGRLPV